MKLSPSLRVTGRVCVFFAIIGLIFFTYYYYEFLTNGVRYIREVDGGPLIKKVTPTLTLVANVVGDYRVTWFSSWLMALMWCVVHGLFAVASFNWLRKARVSALAYMLIMGIAASLVGQFCAFVIEMRYQEIFCGRPSHIYVPNKPAARSWVPQKQPVTRP